MTHVPFQHEHILGALRYSWNCRAGGRCTGRYARDNIRVTSTALPHNTAHPEFVLRPWLKFLRCITLLATTVKTIKHSVLKNISLLSYCWCGLKEFTTPKKKSRKFSQSLIITIENKRFEIFSRPKFYSHFRPTLFYR